MATSDRAAIETLAYQKWQAAGCPDGRALEFWLEAEQTAGATQLAQGNASTTGDARPMGQPRPTPPMVSEDATRGKVSKLEKTAVHRHVE